MDDDEKSAHFLVESGPARDLLKVLVIAAVGAGIGWFGRPAYRSISPGFGSGSLSSQEMIILGAIGVIFGTLALALRLPARRKTNPDDFNEGDFAQREKSPGVAIETTPEDGVGRGNPTFAAQRPALQSRSTGDLQIQPAPPSQPNKPGDPKPDEVSAPYRETITLLLRLRQELHRTIQDDVGRRNKTDIGAAEALFLYLLGDKELTPGELKSSRYDMGSNASAFLNKLLKAGYVQRTEVRTAGRRIAGRLRRVSLTDKGREIRDAVDALFTKHAGTLAPVGGISAGDFSAINKSLHRLERFWLDQVVYRL